MRIGAQVAVIGAGLGGLSNPWSFGGSAHSGGGIPLTLLSGQIVAEEVLP